MADKTGKAIKLTRDDLRSIDVGKTKTFYLPALTYQFQNLMGCKFSVKTDYTANTLTITRNAI